MIPVMKSMELSDDEIIDTFPRPSMIEARKFPPGLMISLTHNELAKMGISYEDMKDGGMVHLHAMARVIGRDSHSGDGGDRCSVRLQIEDLVSGESEDAENKTVDKRMERRAKLYDNGKDDDNE